MSINSHLHSYTLTNLEWMNVYESSEKCTMHNVCSVFFNISTVKRSVQNHFTLNSMSLSRELCTNVYNLKHLCVKQLFMLCGWQHAILEFMHMWCGKEYEFMKMHKWRCRTGSITAHLKSLACLLCSALWH